MTQATDIESREDLRIAILRQLDTDNYVHKEALAQRLGVNERLIRDEIVQMRRAGVAIISSQKGYKLASSVEEILLAKEYLKSYVIDLCLVMRDYKRLIPKFSGQMKMRLI